MLFRWTSSEPERCGGGEDAVHCRVDTTGGTRTRAKKEDEARRVTGRAKLLTAAGRRFRSELVYKCVPWSLGRVCVG